MRLVRVDRERARPGGIAPRGGGACTQRVLGRMRGEEPGAVGCSVGPGARDEETLGWRSIDGLYLVEL